VTCAITLTGNVLCAPTRDDLAGQLHAAIGALHLLLAHPRLRPRHHAGRRHLRTGAAKCVNLRSSLRNTTAMTLRQIFVHCEWSGAER